MAKYAISGQSFHNETLNEDQTPQAMTFKSSSPCILKEFLKNTRRFLNYFNRN